MKKMRKMISLAAAIMMAAGAVNIAALAEETTEPVAAVETVDADRESS